MSNFKNIIKIIFIWIQKFKNQFINSNNFKFKKINNDLWNLLQINTTKIIEFDIA